MARPRKAGNKDLPDNLYVLKNGYFVYYRPDKQKGEQGHSIAMGGERGEAIKAAKILNAELVPASGLANKVLEALQGPVTKFAEHLEYMRKFWVEQGEKGKLSIKTVKRYLQQLKHIETKFGDRIVDVGPDPKHKISVKEVADFLDSFSVNMRKLYRGQLSVIFQHAITRGIVELGKNPAEATLKVSVEVKRKRLTLEAFKAIRAQALPYIQNAMDIALQTLQRESDIVTMNRSNIVEHDGKRFLRVTPEKTKRHNVHLELEVTPTLDAILHRCFESTVTTLKTNQPSYFVHYPFQNGSLRRMANKPLKGVTLSKEFAYARERAIQAGFKFMVLDDDGKPVREMTKEELPTFHEIRALGAKLYEQAGIDPQPLLGHTTAQMTRVYLDRHKVTWVQSTAGLSV